MENRIYLMDGWSFAEEFAPEMVVQAMADELATKVRLPHTVKELPFNYCDENAYQLLSCYQRIIEPMTEWLGQKVLLTFEAVGHEATVYLNGEELAQHKNGYTAFSVDLTEHLLYGQENLLTVKVDSRESLNQPPFGFVIDYLTYGGIYRDVYLEIKNEVYLEDVFLQPSFSLDVNTTGMSPEQIAQLTTVGVLATDVTLSPAARTALSYGRLAVRQLLGSKVVYEVPRMNTHFSVMMDGIHPWDIESPVLYRITTQLLLDGEVVDEHVASIGFRTARFKKKGFYLNGRRVLIRGLNRHQSYAYVGYAMPESMQRYDARILKEELGVNTVRTSHYPQSQYFLDECDKLGLLVVTEFPGWQHIGDEAWKDVAVDNVRQMVEQYRNHPSIILWGVRINESEDDHDFYLRTNELCHELDATRPTGGVRNFKKSELLEDVYTYNEFLHTGDNPGCDLVEKVTSDTSKPYLITEFMGHMYPSKAFDWEEHRMSHMLRHANVLNDVAAQANGSGCIGWCMFDYNTHKDFGSGDRICYHGVMDMFRNPKLAASLYAAQGAKEPVLAVSSSMDIGEHPGCNRGDTFIITNADAVRMYKNDVLLKEYTRRDTKHKNIPHGPILIDDYIGNAMEEAEGFGPVQIKLAKALLNSVANKGYKLGAKQLAIAAWLIAIYRMNFGDAMRLYNTYVGDWGGASKEYRFDALVNGEVVESITCAAVQSKALEVKASHTTLVEGITYDVAELRIKAVDQNGNQLYYLQEPIMVKLSGPIELIGPSAVSLRGGVCGVYIKTCGKAGSSKVSLTAHGIEKLEIKLEVM